MDFLIDVLMVVVFAVMLAPAALWLFTFGVAVVAQAEIDEKKAKSNKQA